jgi:Galactosyltransferase
VFDHKRLISSLPVNWCWLVEYLLGICSEQKDDPDELRIQQEIAKYNDILRLDLVDTYNDLSLKTLKMFSVLPSKFDADFYFKIDDDVAVNVYAMADYLAARRTQGNLYLVSLESLHLKGQKDHQSHT